MIIQTVTDQNPGQYSGHHAVSKGNVMPAKKKLGNKSAETRKRIFIQHYLKTYNATQSAIAAKFSPKSAECQGSRLLRNVKVQEAIAQEERKLENKVFTSKEKILRELALIGYSDMKDYITIDSTGCVQAIGIDDLVLGASRAIKKVKEKRVIKASQGTKDKPSEDTILESTFEFELHDKITALINMGKELGMFREKHEVGLDEKAIEVILGALPKEIADEVRTKLLAIKVD